MTFIAKNSKILKYEVVMMRGDNIIDEGPLGEVAARRGVKPETIEFYLTPSYQRRLAKSKDLDRRITVTRTDIDDEDEL